MESSLEIAERKAQSVSERINREDSWIFFLDFRVKDQARKKRSEMNDVSLWF